MLNPLFSVGKDELPLYLLSDNHSLQMPFKEVINKCENQFMARLSEHQQPFIVSWDFEGFVHWDEEGKTIDLGLNELQIVEDKEIPVRQHSIDLQLRLNAIISTYKDEDYVKTITIINEFLNENYSITDFVKFNLECITAISHRMIGENQISAELFSQIEERYISEFSAKDIDYLVKNRIISSDKTKIVWHKGILNWDVGTVHYYWAYSLYDQEKYQDALIHFAKSLKIRIDNSLAEDYANTLIFIGIVYESLFDFELSLHYFNDAINFLEQRDEYGESMIMALYRSSFVNLRMNNFENALNLANKAQQYNSKTNDEESSTMVLEIIGGIHKFQGEFEQAIISYEKCLAIQLSINDIRVYQTHFDLFMSYLKLDQRKNAALHLDKLERLVDEYQQNRHIYLKKAQSVYALCKARFISSQDQSNNINHATTLYLKVIDDPETDPYYLMHAYLNYTNLQLSNLELRGDKSIEGLRTILSKMQEHASRYNLHSLTVKGTWIQYKIALFENKDQEADLYMKKMQLLISKYTLDLLNKRIIKDIEDLQRGASGIKLTDILFDEIQYEKYQIVISGA
jgi:tetratricopeptide (TPR) repeat protein